MAILLISRCSKLFPNDVLLPTSWQFDVVVMYDVTVGYYDAAPEVRYFTHVFGFESFLV